MAYSQDMWRDFLRDFIIEVVRRPVLIVGNSIGGFMAASLAGDYPDLAEGEQRQHNLQAIAKSSACGKERWLRTETSWPPPPCACSRYKSCPQQRSLLHS